MKWMPVNIRLPESDDEVLGCGAISYLEDDPVEYMGIVRFVRDNRSSLVGEFADGALLTECLHYSIINQDGMWIDVRWCTCVNVSHWMPLPEKPNLTEGIE